MPRHVVEGPQLHGDIPQGFGISTNEPVFDPQIHLQIEPPPVVFSESFETSAFPPPATGFSLGYSKPFRLLSDKGVEDFRQIVQANKQFAKTNNERTPNCLRGLGYRSQFVRDVTYSKEVTSFLGALAGKPVAPHTCTMNMAHTNIGAIPQQQDTPVLVDQWHVDSVDYVLVIMLSEPRNIKGGNLEVLHQLGLRDNHELLQSDISRDMGDQVHAIEYPGAGYAVFLQGSKILHHVSLITAASEERITVVNAYMNLDVFEPDSTRFHTFNHQDPSHVAGVEFARHTAWRVRGLMDYISSEVEFGRDREELAGLLERASQTLARSANLLVGKEDDVLQWSDETKKIKAKL
jgi:hypothetical protein